MYKTLIGNRGRAVGWRLDFLFFVRQQPKSPLAAINDQAKNYRKKLLNKVR
jgi:hypothetical protein